MYLSIKYPGGNILEDIADANNFTDGKCPNDHFLCANDKCLVASYMERRLSKMLIPVFSRSIKMYTIKMS